MNEHSLNAFIEQRLAERRAAGLLRQRRQIRVIDAVHVEIDGSRRCANFASNNYLGLTHHPRIIAAAERSLRSTGFGSGASGLVSGYSETHANAEAAIARWKGAEASVLLPSGYQAAHAAVQTLTALAGPGQVRFVLDKLAHASLIDAVAASRQPFRIFPHNHLRKLERLLSEADPGQHQVVITESIFSMDGDACDLPAIAALRRRFAFTLLLDEAHSSGVYGRNGAGYAAELGLADEVDLSIVTLSKAAGAGGGAVCGSRLFCDALLNWGRAYIYSTSVPSSVAAAISEAIAVMADEPQRQQRLRDNARNLRSLLRQRKLALMDGDSPIIPIVLGSEAAAMQAGERLIERGYLVVPIRPPTVAPGTSRLRITVSSEHTEMQLRGLAEAIATQLS